MNTFFIHIPKCGGTSVQVALDELNVNYTRVNQDQLEEARPLIEQENSGIFIGHCDFDSVHNIRPDTRFAAFIREPFKRAVSFYNYILSRENDPQYESVGKMSLEEYLGYYENEMCNILFGCRCFNSEHLNKYIFIGNIDMLIVCPIFFHETKKDRGINCF